MQLSGLGVYFVPSFKIIYSISLIAVRLLIPFLSCRFWIVVVFLNLSILSTFQQSMVIVTLYILILLLYFYFLGEQYSCFQCIHIVVQPFQNILIIPKRNSIHQQSLPFFSSSRPYQLLVYFLSLWTFHTNGITEYVAFVDCLLSLNIIFSSYAMLQYVAVHHSFLLPINGSLQGHSTFC